MKTFAHNFNGHHIINQILNSEWFKCNTTKSSWAMITEGLIVEGRLTEVLVNEKR